jgi:hypothetical protein
MKKIILGSIAALAIAAVAVVNVNLDSKSSDLSAISLANVEALAGEGSGLGCGYAAYEWDDDWYEDTKSFIKCTSGCPEGSGTSPKYIHC